MPLVQDILRGLLVESQEVNVPLTLVEMLQRRFPFEPAVEDSILFTLGQRPPFPARGHSYSDVSNQGAQESSEDREAEVSPYENILRSLAQERSMFDASGNCICTDVELASLYEAD
ncbi:hypothetical protein DUNSADRAFT_17298 [Dunaliella salina]|uniref:Encoded protein n=1 Tax=Dunaliella salina TaxID=3046 RepID=A0ABQ7G220_DUNSA|nr:hypothetical protein DUNSADRAFT_17298 [Dunaliella salina]|eukprot:KAF5828641.1 hypothetical protein DUNSADRAFT_17298 [Dunaliella salina]